MTYRELLELAAKAAGLNGRYNNEVACMRLLPGKKTPYGTTYAYWDPIADDGAALRLAVTLRFGIKDFAPHDMPDIAQAPPDAALFGMVEIWRESDEDPIHVEYYKAGADRNAATRNAIVRAAAEIGKAKP